MGRRRNQKLRTPNKMMIHPITVTLTGRLPFAGDVEPAILYSIINADPESASKLVKDIPPDLERIIERTLEKNPDERYSTMD